MKTSEQWWEEVKCDQHKLEKWLQRQYVGEIAAVNLLSQVLIRFGSEMTTEQWDNVHKVMLQEATHGKWMKQLLDVRGVKPEKNASAERRYWKEVLPSVDNFEKSMAAAHNAEEMRLHRIRAIANDKTAPDDISKVFQKILPHEEWHEEVFNEMKGNTDLSNEHKRGLNALSLVLA